jgi:Tfp pilus assembly protein PilZ
LAFSVRFGRVGEPQVELPSRDLSTQGVFVLSVQPLPVGAEVAMTLEILGSAAMDLRGTVVRTQLVTHIGDGPVLSGMGVRFKDMSPADRDRLGAMVASVRKALSLS